MNVVYWMFLVGASLLLLPILVIGFIFLPPYTVGVVVTFTAFLLGIIVGPFVLLRVL